MSHSGGFDLIAAKVGEPGQDSGHVGDSRPDRPHSDWCGGDPDVPAVPGVSGVSGHEPGPWHYDEGMTLPPEGDVVTVHIELTQEVDENGARIRRADEVGDYAYAEHRLSEPGRRELTWNLPPSTEERYYDVVASNTWDPNTPGQEVTSSLDARPAVPGTPSPTCR